MFTSCAPRPAHNGIPWRRLAVAVITVLVSTLGGAPPGNAWAEVHRAAGPPFVRVEGAGFALGATLLPSIHGVNYEGPVDQAWHMWDPATFNPQLIAVDLDRAVRAGYDPIRIFVQAPLASQVLAGDYTRLDTVVGLARARGLHLLLTFNDAHDPDLAAVTRVDRLIAAHLAGEPAIFGYDIENEPGFAQIAAASYPPGVAVPLQGMAGATLLASYATAPPGSPMHPGMVDQPAPVQGPPRVAPFASLLALFGRFQAANPAYPQTPAGPYWQPFLAACNATLAAYLQVQMAALRAVDTRHLITVGYNSAFWAALPANGVLDFRSLHLYPAPDYPSIVGALRLFGSVRARAATPLVLEEYGFSSGAQPAQAAAVQEMAMQLGVAARGGAGDIKWMLNDVPYGTSVLENNLGVFDSAGQPKPSFTASAAAALLPALRGVGTDTVVLAPDDRAGIGFVLTSENGFATSRPIYADSRLRYAMGGGVAGQLWLSWASPGHLRIVATQAATITLNLRTLVTAASAAPLAVVPGTLAWSRQGTWFTISLPPGLAVEVGYRPAPPPAPPIASPTLHAPWVSDSGVSDHQRQVFLRHYRSFVMVAVPALRLRSAPRLSAPPVALILSATHMAVLGTSGAWLHVVLAQALDGWVYRTYVSGMVTPVAALAPSGTQRPAARPPAGAVAGHAAYVLADGVHVRRGPRLAARSLFLASRGSRVVVRAVHVSWVRITFANGATGWMLGHYLRVMAAPSGAAPTTSQVFRAAAPRVSPMVAYVWAQALYVRAAPRLSGRVVDLAARNAILRVLGTHVSWTQVRLPDGTLGWVRTHYIKDHPRPKAGE